MDVRVELLADDVCAAKEDKTGFLSVGVDIFDRLYLKERHSRNLFYLLQLHIHHLQVIRH